MALEVVLVANWQHECCGDVVALGDVVSWRLKREFDREWLTRTYGVEQMAELTAVEERHGDEAPTDEVVRGRVIRLRSVTCRQRPAPDSRGVGDHPVEHRGRVESRRQMLRSESVAEGESWVGYIVDLERV